MRCDGDTAAQAEQEVRGIEVHTYLGKTIQTVPLKEGLEPKAESLEP